jgi:hypothetical protein
VAQHDDEEGLKHLRPIVEGAGHRVVEYVPSCTNDEEVSDALVEDQLHGNARIRAGEDHRVRALRCRDRDHMRSIATRGDRIADGPTLVSSLESTEDFAGGSGVGHGTP